MPTATPKPCPRSTGSAATPPPSVRLLVVSDVHFHTPLFQQHQVNGGRSLTDSPSRLSTDIALGDPQNPFYALLRLVRDGKVKADVLVCCGDLTTCADPTAMNLGWLQLHRLADALKAGEPVVTAGNHDIDSRFKVSGTSPSRALKLLDPPFPSADSRAAASYWSNGYCILERKPYLRIILANTCALHGYSTETDRQSDHGAFSEQLLHEIPTAIEAWRAPLNILLCHHHPREIDLPGEDRSVARDGERLLATLERLGQPNWLVLHGHRHLPSVKYASSNASSPIIFSAGSFAASLHLRIQGRTANQFYIIDIENTDAQLRGRFEAWTWSQHEAEWRRGEDTSALPASGGFGYRPYLAHAAQVIASLVPARMDGTISWRDIETRAPDLRFLLIDDRSPLLDLLRANHGIEWESPNGRPMVGSGFLRLGRIR
ncbi:metallophosphoesterase family protein [Rubrivivax gelatinosus]|uniref:metallophosphoesterase family protein n=1 Tax=Rubrivivax gelatinosus TaxID=28068 RepID=UPI003D31F2F1